MAATQHYRAQHAELLVLADQLAVLIGDENLASSAATVRSLVSVLAGKLSIHLATKDKRLYPNLIAHNDPEVRALARLNADEMGLLAKAFIQFNRHWLTAAQIEKASAQFVLDATQIIVALRERIEKENDGLFKLVDQID